MDTIKSFVTFLDSGELNDETLKQAQAELGAGDLRVVVIKLLGWMKSQHRMGRSLALSLKKDHVWHGNLRNLIEEKKLFQGFLAIENDQVVSAPSLTEESWITLCKLVDREYNPPIRT